MYYVYIPPTFPKNFLRRVLGKLGEKLSISAFLI